MIDARQQKFDKQLKDAALKLSCVYPHVRTWETAIDGGADLGAWSVLLATRFQQVYAFEPCPTSFAACQAYTQEHAHICVSPRALAEKYGCGRMISDGKHTPYFTHDASGEVPCLPLDMLALPHVGCMKLDLEGGEYNALLGAEQTIRRDRPVLIIEIANKVLPSHCYGRAADDPVRLLASWGATQIAYIGPDYICHWDTE